MATALPATDSGNQGKKRLPIDCRSWFFIINQLRQQVPLTFIIEKKLCAAADK
jgi:hypothetical protein